MQIQGLKKISVIQKIIYFSVLAGIIIALLIFFVLLPSADNIKDIKKDIKDQRVKLKKKYLMGLNAKMLSQNVKEIKNNLKIFDKIFIPKDGYLNLVTSLEGLAQKNGLKEKLNILTNNAKDKGDYKVVPVHIELKGDFRNQLAFISDLKSETDYQFNIKSLKFRSEDPSALSALKKRPPQETREVVTTTTTVKVKEDGATTTKEITMERTLTSTPQKNISMMVLGKIYWKK